MRTQCEIDDFTDEELRAFDESRFCVLQILLLVIPVTIVDEITPYITPCHADCQFTLDDRKVFLDIFRQNGNLKCSKISLSDFECASGGSHHH